MNDITQKNTDFINLYNRSYRLTAAVFAISNVIDQSEELRTKIKKLSLELVCMSVNLKDIDFLEAKKLIGDIEKNSLLLMSMLDIASLTGLISTMNGNVIKEEFQSFILELSKFTKKFEDDKNTAVTSMFIKSSVATNDERPEDFNLKKLATLQHIGLNQLPKDDQKSSNGHRRKDLRKNTILDFIKGHNNVSIKDIVPNVIGCSEKTIQRELIELISENKIIKIGERRWSKYSII